MSPCRGSLRKRFPPLGIVAVAEDDRTKAGDEVGVFDVQLGRVRGERAAARRRKSARSKLGPTMNSQVRSAVVGRRAHGMARSIAFCPFAKTGSPDTMTIGLGLGCKPCNHWDREGVFMATSSGQSFRAAKTGLCWDWEQDSLLAAARRRPRRECRGPDPDQPAAAAVAEFVPQALFEQLFFAPRHRPCQGGFYTYQAFLDAAKRFRASPSRAPRTIASVSWRRFCQHRP